MACIDEQQQQQEQPTFKHYCRVCKKGFMCGRALGGHMRAHGIGDENGILDDDDDDDRVSDFDRTSNKRMYQLRTNPNRLKSCRSCENCGKEFLSWKSFLEHGKCSSDDLSESPVSSPESEGEDDGGGRRGGGGWSKRKRSMRAKVGCIGSNYPPSEDEDLLLARCLVQLANTMVDPPLVSEPEESCASASKDEERRNPNTYLGANRAPLDKAKGIANPKGLFECKACKKVFNSHQALGGHRASHKKVKGCYAAKQDQLEDNIIVGEDDDMVTNDEFLNIPSKSTPSFQIDQGPPLVGTARRKAKVHECSICHRVFSSGQALGGHKRCHWITSNSSQDTSTSTKFHFQDNINPINHSPHHHYKQKIENSDKLDLNVPAWAHMSGVRRDPCNPLSFEVPTDTHLQPWIGNPQNLPLKNENENNNDDNNNNNNNNDNSDNEINIKNGVDDEADSMLKLAKLSELKDMDTSTSTSQWLQVGLGSRVEAANDQ